MKLKRCLTSMVTSPLTLLLLHPGMSLGAATSLEVKATGTKTLYLNDRAGNNQVTFFSESTIEDFTGMCNKVQGTCKLDPHNLGSFTGEFSLRIEDLKTGIDLRDQHLRGPAWMDAGSYPLVKIKISKIENVKKTSPNSAEMTMLGNCTFHGKTSDVRIEATLAYLDETPETMRRVAGDLVRVRGSFEVKLSEFGVTGPPGSGTIGLKVSDVIRIRATVFGSTQPPPAPLEVDEKVAASGPATRPANQPATRSAPGGILKRPPPKRSG